jgi:hypothetical protein
MRDGRPNWRTDPRKLYTAAGPTKDLPNPDRTSLNVAAHIAVSSANDLSDFAVILCNLLRRVNTPRK